MIYPRTALLLSAIALGLSACGAGMSAEEIKSAEATSAVAPPSADTCEGVARQIALAERNPGLYDKSGMDWLANMRRRCGLAN